MWGRPAGRSAALQADHHERERRAWDAGARGEAEVAAELATLPSGEWWTFHDVPVGGRGRNIDHLVIGIGGVYSINTKLRNGHVWVAERAILVDGQKTDFLPVAVHEAHDAAARLSRAMGAPVTVVPTLAFVAARLTIKAAPADVAVLTAPDLAAWLRSRETTLTPHEAYDIVLAAHRRETWT